MSDYLHATAIVIGEKGVLLVGASGAGKSALAERLIAEAQMAGQFARLIGDDRIAVTRVGEHLIATGHPTIRGRIERRGIGIVSSDHIDSAVLAGIVEIIPSPERLPAEPLPTFHHAGVNLPLLTLRDDRDLSTRAHLVLDWLRRGISHLRKKD